MDAALLELPKPLPTVSPAPLPEVPTPESAAHVLSDTLPRPAWIEVDLLQLKRNFELINRDKSPQVRVLSVIKDEAYGHGNRHIEA